MTLGKATRRSFSIIRSSSWPGFRVDRSISHDVRGYSHSDCENCLDLLMLNVAHSEVHICFLPETLNPED